MTDDDTKPRYGSVYARGFNDGLRAAGVANPYEVPFVSTKPKKELDSLNAALNMASKQGSTSPSNQAFKKPSEITQARFTSVYNGLSVVLQNLYECVPINDRWTVEQVASEFSRKTGTKPASEIKKMLNTLDSNGLVINDSGLFRRVKVSGNPSSLNLVKTTVITEKNEKARLEIYQLTPARNVMDILSKIAANARTLAGDMKALATEIDDAALEIEQEFQNSEAKSEKLKQLQTLLKNIAE